MKRKARPKPTNDELRHKAVKGKYRVKHGD